ncbi:MAG: DegT/DnrJ/EryC1/StrS family aminotransferase [bacterium]
MKTKPIRHSMPTLDHREIDALADTIRSNHIAAGDQVALFEDEMARYCGASGAVGCSSGTAALHLALLAIGVGQGMEVIIPSFTCASLYHAVTYTGAVPVLADCDPDTFLLTAPTIMARITHRTKAVIVPHMFGLPADMKEIVSLGLPVIEDISQAIGATYMGRRTGCLSEVAVSSFYATKLITTGTGGMVLSGNPRVLGKVRELNGVDKKKDLNCHLPYMMNDLQASMGRCQLRKLDDFISKRRDLASHLSLALKSIPAAPPGDLSFREHIFFRYCVKIHKPVEPVLAFLRRNGIEAARPIFSPLHLLDKRETATSGGDFPGTMEAWRETISLPIHPGLTNKEVLREACLLGDILNVMAYSNA